jgi:DNA-binding LacI/PurR family transcriptional regulator
MQDIAQRVGVTKMTVSAVLSAKPSNVGVSEATREKILRAAKEMEYRPNALARSLRLRKTDIFGFYTGYPFLDLRNPFLSELLSGIQEGCSLFRKDLLLHSLFRGKAVEDIYAELVDGRIDGLVIQTQPEDTLVSLLVASGLPAVAVADSIPTLPSVVVDDVAGARLTVEYLVGRGHRYLLYLSPRYRLMSATRRRKSFMQAARAYGLGIREWADPPARGDDELWLNRGIQRQEYGECDVDARDAAWLESLLRSRAPDCPTAAVCWCDGAAYRLVNLCRGWGVRVPEDLAIVGFDDAHNPVDSPWRLTTVHAPWRETARTAVTLLMAQLAGEEVAQETVLPVEFVFGDSA